MDKLIADILLRLPGGAAVESHQRLRHGCDAGELNFELGPAFVVQRYRQGCSISRMYVGQSSLLSLMMTP
jgi:hypothetical protein